MSEMKKILLAIVLGVFIGIGAFFYPTTVSQTANTVLEGGAVPQAYVRESASKSIGTWPVGIGLLLGAIAGFGAFLFAKWRSKLT